MNRDSTKWRPRPIDYIRRLGLGMLLAYFGFHAVWSAPHEWQTWWGVAAFAVVFIAQFRDEHQQKQKRNEKATGGEHPPTTHPAGAKA